MSQLRLQSFRSTLIRMQDRKIGKTKKTGSTAGPIARITFNSRDKRTRYSVYLMTVLTNSLSRTEKERDNKFPCKILVKWMQESNGC